MSIRNLCTALAVVLLSITITRANAQFSLVWDNGGHFAFPASTLTPANPPDGLMASGERHDITGTLTNTSGQTLYVSSATWYGLQTADGIYLDYENNTYSAGTYPGDELSFLLNAEGIAPGASFRGALSAIYIDSSTAMGLYDRSGDDQTQFANAGILTIQAYTDPAKTIAVDNFRSSNISIQIVSGRNSTPEPGAWLLFSTLVCTGALCIKRRTAL